jgi:hypothetical protein
MNMDITALLYGLRCGFCGFLLALADRFADGSVFNLVWGFPQSSPFAQFH